MSATLAPRSREQKLAALDKANRIRMARAALKLAVKYGDVEAWAVIDEPHPDYATMRVHVLLCALPQYGPTRARRLMDTHYVSMTKTLGGLSRRQRDELVVALRSRP